MLKINVEINHNGSYEMRFLDCDSDDTLSSQNRMFVVGTGNTSKSYYT